MRVEKKHHLAKLRRWRIRKKIIGTRDRPRLSVHFSDRNIHVQFIDDVAGVTLASTSTLAKTIPDRGHLSANAKSAAIVGAQAAIEAQAKGIKEVLFDRSGALYHGKVKALADAARKGGLKF